MAALTLISNHGRPLQPLVEAAIQNELRILQAGIARTEQRLRAFETHYGFSSEKFIQQYENDELSETLDFIEWIGEYRLLQRLNDKVKTLQGIRFAN